MAEHLYLGFVDKQLRTNKQAALSLEHDARAKVGYLFDLLKPGETFRSGSWVLANGQKITAYVWNDILGKRATVRLEAPSEKKLFPYYKAYVETGLAILDQWCELPNIWFTDEISNWMNNRISNGAFSLNGEGVFIPTDASAGYPPLTKFKRDRDIRGTDLENMGESKFHNCRFAATETSERREELPGFSYYPPPSSIFSGKMMPLWVQAQYGSRKVEYHYLQPFTVDKLSNLPSKSNWIIEHKDKTRLEWWGIDAVSNSKLRATKLKLDPIANILKHYLFNHFGELSEEEKTWLRVWIFRGATWSSKEKDWITLYSKLPILAGTLGYGWHVSDSGFKATIICGKTETSSSDNNRGVRFTKYNLSLSLIYESQIISSIETPTWNVDLSSKGAGYVQTVLADPLVIWRINSSAQSVWFLTNGIDPSMVPDRKPTSAEIWGYYNGEIWNAINVYDSGLIDNYYMQPECSPGTCLTTTWEYEGTCTVGTPKQVSAKYRTIRVGNKQKQVENTLRKSYSNFYFGGGGSSFSDREWPWDFPYSHCTQNNAPHYPPCTNFYPKMYESGQTSLRYYEHSSVDPTMVKPTLTLIIPYGFCDSYILVEQEYNKGATTHAKTVSADGNNNPWAVRSGSWTMKYECYTTSDPDSFEWRINSYTITARQEVNREKTLINKTSETSRTSIQSTLYYANNSLSLYQDDVGSTIKAPGNYAANFQSSNNRTIDYAGYRAYFDPHPTDTGPITLQAQRSAGYKIVTAIATPIGSSEIVTNNGLPNPIPRRRLWVGAS